MAHSNMSLSPRSIEPANEQTDEPSRESTNPFIGLLETEDKSDLVSNCAASDTVTVSPRAVNQITSDELSDVSPISATCEDMTANYIGEIRYNSPGHSAVRGSGPSSVCSPFESPTHIASSRYDDDSSCRPDSLYLSRSAIQRREKQWLAKKGSYSSLSECDSSHSGSMEALIEAATSTPLHTQGTVAIDGDMITFVADGINELIKRSRNDSLSTSVMSNHTHRSTSTGSVSSSTSGWSASALSPGFSRMTRSPSVHSPEDIPPIDPRALHDLEIHAHHVADSVDFMMQMLTNKLYKMSTHTHSTLDVYKDAVDNTCDAVDCSIKSMYALMAKCEELNRTIAPIYQLQEQIREIKRLLDLFEAQTAFD